MSAQPGRWTVLRDLMSYAGGWLLICKQAGIAFAPPAQVNLPILIMGGLLVGVPGLAQMVLWWMSSRGTGMDGPPSSPAPRPLPSSDTPSRAPSSGDA